DAADDRRQRIWAVQVPVPDLVLLGVEILLRPRVAGSRLHQFECRSVDDVVRRQGGGQDEPGDERAATPGLEVLGQDVGSVGPEVRSEELGWLAAGQLCRVLAQLPGRVPPGEV